MLYKNLHLFLRQKVLIKSELPVFNLQEILRIIELLVFFPCTGMSISLEAGDKKIIWIWLLTVGCLDELKQVVLALKKKCATTPPVYVQRSAYYSKATFSRKSSQGRMLTIVLKQLM